MRKFSLKELYSVVDGRLSTKIETVYDILNIASGSSLMTHHLPVAVDYLKQNKPQWYKDAEVDLGVVEKVVGKDFEKQMEWIDENFSNIEYEVTEVENKDEMWKYMMDNSLLHQTR